MNVHMDERTRRIVGGNTAAAGNKPVLVLETDFEKYPHPPHARTRTAEQLPPESMAAALESVIGSESSNTRTRPRFSAGGLTTGSNSSDAEGGDITGDEDEGDDDEENNDQDMGLDSDHDIDIDMNSAAASQTGSYSTLCDCFACFVVDAPPPPPTFSSPFSLSFSFCAFVLTNALTHNLHATTPQPNSTTNPNPTPTQTQPQPNPNPTLGWGVGFPHSSNMA